MGYLSASEHKSLAIWAAACAENVLPLFEKYNPGDDRPRKAIEGSRAWVKGDLTIGDARKLAFAAHAAARETTIPCAKFAARAAGHAAATPHVANHAKVAYTYALKAAGDTMIELFPTDSI